MLCAESKRAGQTADVLSIKQNGKTVGHDATEV